VPGFPGTGTTISWLKGSGRVMAYILMLLLTFLAGWLLRGTGLSWWAAAAMQMAAGLLLALLFRFTEPLKSLKLLTERPGSV